MLAGRVKACQACIARARRYKDITSTLDSSRYLSSTPPAPAQLIEGFQTDWDNRPPDFPLQNPSSSFHHTPKHDISESSRRQQGQRIEEPPPIDLEYWGFSENDIESSISQASSSSSSAISDPFLARSSDIAGYGPVMEMDEIQPGRRATVQPDPTRPRRSWLSDLPALPVSEVVGERYRWEDRALGRVRASQMRRSIARGKGKQREVELAVSVGTGARDIRGKEGEKRERWFPILDRKRVYTEQRNLRGDQPFAREVQRYIDQYAFYPFSDTSIAVMLFLSTSACLTSFSIRVSADRSYLASYPC
jgi:hypothetical protein